MYSYNFGVIVIRQNSPIYMVLNFNQACLNFTLKKTAAVEVKQYSVYYMIEIDGGKWKIPYITDLSDPL